MTSPVYPNDTSKWMLHTERLVADFPLTVEQIITVTLTSWEDIFRSRIGKNRFRIGREVMPQPQIMGFLLHELIPLNLEAAYPGQWRRGRAATECDAVFVRDDKWSFEIKTSSSQSGIFGNRSYAQVSVKASKRRGSIFLAVKFGKFVTGSARPEVTLIRIGWLGPEDWIGQLAQSGQQAHLTKEARAFKLKVIYDASKQ